MEAGKREEEVKLSEFQLVNVAGSEQDTLSNCAESLWGRRGSLTKVARRGRYGAHGKEASPPASFPVSYHLSALGWSYQVS